MIYTGIGSRKIPDDVLQSMYSIGVKFADKGYILRSGGAGGSDEAFELGCDDKGGDKEIYLPYKLFRKNPSQLYPDKLDNWKDAMVIAEEFHPRWKSLSKYAIEFHTRNVYQVLGKNLNTPTDFVVCYTPDGKFTGGTGQALRIADHYNIPIYNLFDKEILSKINK